MSEVNLDLSINRWISRKLYVFIISTAGLLYGQIISGDSIIVATYIIIQGITDMVKSLLAARKGTEDE